MGNTSSYPIPAILNERPVDPRGYVVPFFVPIVNGKPDFRYQDAGKRKLCLDRGLCSICGKKLYPKSYWFISGPMGMMNQVASDAPMHEDCARYSLNVCPHIFLHKAERRSEEGNNPNLLRNKPDQIFLIKADKIGLTYDQGHTYITFRPVYNELYGYIDNKLIRKP